MNEKVRTFRDLRVFIAVYEERSFTLAAAREHATQSGVSQHIRNLETMLGLKLFERTTSSVVPTPAGTAYYEGCVKVLSAKDQADKAIQEFAGGLEGEVVVGLMPTMTRALLGPALAKFVSLHPNVALRVVEAFSGELTKQVRAGDLAFAIVPPLTREAGVKSTFFARTPEFLVSGGRLGLRHLAPARLGTLGPLKMVVPSASNTRRHQIETYLSSTGAVVERRLELDTMLGALDFVRTTDWVAILPGLMIAPDLAGESITINPLIEPPLVLDLLLLQPARRSMSRAALAFLDILRAEADVVDNEVRRCVSPPSSHAACEPGSGPAI